MFNPRNNQLATAALRILVTESLKWEKSCGTAEQYYPMTAAEVLPYSATHLHAYLVTQLNNRAWLRLRTRDDYKAISKAHSDLYLQKFEPNVYFSRQAKLSLVASPQE